MWYLVIHKVATVKVIDYGVLTMLSTLLKPLVYLLAAVLVCACWGDSDYLTGKIAVLPHL